jgi:hypothetical protein
VLGQIEMLLGFDLPFVLRQPDLELLLSRLGVLELLDAQRARI